MVEVAVTSLLLAAGMTATLHVLGWIAAERRASERRQCALQEVGNLMERLAAQPWKELTPENVRQYELSDSARRLLPGPELSIRIEHDRAVPESKRLAITLRWRNRSGTWDAPARLSAWVFRREEPR